MVSSLRFWPCCVVSLLAWTGEAAGAAPAPPALVVVVSLDQFRADYLERFRAHYGRGGFNLFLERGAVFVDCHYQHSVTKTACGHSVMLTGVHADQHGIIANEWIDRATLQQVSCVGDDTAPIVGLPPPSRPPVTGLDNPYLGRSARSLLASTVGDELKLARGGRPKVFGVSIKDRSAILMAGRRADAAYFMEEGRMVSSTYYLAQVPDWVAGWNEAKKVDAYFGRVWERVLPEAAYAQQGPDDMPNELALYGLGRTLPKRIDGGETTPGPKFASAFENSPFQSEVLADFAKTLVERENLGRRGVTDLLCLSFSTPDTIGHSYGPDSHEVMDNAVRTDRILADLFQFLDRHVGLDRCTLVLTADHGAAPIPEVVASTQRGVPAGRAKSAEVLRATEAALNERFGPLANKERWLVNDDCALLIHPQALAEKKLTSSEVEQVVRDALLKLPFVRAAYTRTDLLRGIAPGEWGRHMLASFHSERSADVLFQLQPYFLLSSRTHGTTHGTPYNYDTHVPLLWFGVGVTPGVRTERVGVDDLAPTLSRILGLVAPPLAKGRVLF